MAEIVDLTSLIRGDDTLVDVEALDGIAAPASTEATDDATEIGLDASEVGLLHFGKKDALGAPKTPDPALDWSNQELADLYRVQRLLGQAGIGVETDRGVSDEGDPWFVYVDARGEVFVHLSRIDGVYVLDSAVQDEVVTGSCFATLIERFAGRAEAAAAVRPDGANIVSMHRRGKIVLHPGAALAALVWSVLLFSDDLVFLEGPQGEQDAARPDAAIPAAASESDDVAEANDSTAEGPNAFEELFADKEDAASFLSDAMAGREGERSGPADLRDTAHAGGQAAQSATLAGIGLTALAAAYGINRTQPRDDAGMEEGETVALSTQHDAQALASDTAQDPQIAERQSPSDATAGALFDETTQEDAVAASAEGMDPAETAQSAEPDATVLAADAVALGQAAQEAPGTPQLPLEDDALAGAMDAQGLKPASDAATEDVTTARTAPGSDLGAAPITQLLESVGLIDLIDFAGERFDTSNDRLVASADDFFRFLDETALGAVDSGSAPDGGAPATALSPLEPIALAPVDTSVTNAPLIPMSSSAIPARPAPPVLSPQPEFEFEAFNDDVRDYIDHMIVTSEVEFIELEDQILVIDVKALSEGGEAFARTWSLDAEMTVSTIGVRADFEAFDLIA